jgi:hypothetical protein
MRHPSWIAGHLRQSFLPARRQRVGPIGIDYRDGFVRIVQVASDRRSHVVASACVAYDQAAPERSTEAIMHAIDGGGFRGRACVLAVPSTTVRCISLTVSDAEDATIIGELERLLPERFGVDRLECDFVRLGGSGDGGLEIAAIAADRASLERIAHPLIDEGLWPEAIEPGFLAVARACTRTARRASDRGRLRVAAELTETGAVVMVLQGQSLLHVQPLASRAELPAALRSAVVEAERLGGPRGQVHAELLPEIRIAGSAAYEVGFLEQVERLTGLPVRHDDQLGTLATAYAEIGVHASDRGGAAAWAGALGAAFRPLAEASATRQEPLAASTREAA